MLKITQTSHPKKELGRNGANVRNNVNGGKSEYSNRKKNIDKISMKYDNNCK